MVYGNGIFMTVTPGERHNYLAVRLSRYRARDPYIMAAGSEPREKLWIGADAPSLEAKPEDSFEVHVPGYDLRRLLLARDPLAAVLAFGVQIRGVLATISGIRMCPDCPHCADSDSPCMDAFGSCAEPMGGFAGRSDGLAGAVECQKSKGCLHLHFWNFIQRLHQFHSLQEIGEMLEKALVEASELKRFVENLCNERYPCEADLAEEVAELEQCWPCFKEEPQSDRFAAVSWGDDRFGRIPPFVWEDSGPDDAASRLSLPRAAGQSTSSARLEEDARRYQSAFDLALQENQKCAQHHMHPRKRGSAERSIPNACLNARSGGRCKADFPMHSRMNAERPLLLCKGLAKQHHLPHKGRRRVLDQVLGRRNDP